MGNRGTVVVMSKRVGSGLLKALLDAIHTADNDIAGQAITKLRAPLDSDDVEILVDTTVGFGEYTDGDGDGRVVVGGEIISFTGRTDDTFTGLTRGISNTKTQARYAPGTVVYDRARNTSALDLVRRGLLVDFAIGEDLDVIGRNLGLRKCVGITDDQWREVIRQVAYLAKQPVSAILAALEALQGVGNAFVYERAVTSPHKIFGDITIDLASSLEGRFYLNSGVKHTVAAGGTIDVGHTIVPSDHAGTTAKGEIRVISGLYLIDGENFVLDDGTNPAVTFEFDDDASVVESPTLRAVNFTASDTEEEVQASIVAAINAAPSLTIDADPAGSQRVSLENTVVGAAGNTTSTETVVDSVFQVSNMSGGEDASSVGVLGVYLQNTATRAGVREGQTNLFTGGSFAGQIITLGVDPGLGTAVLVDYNAFRAHYLPPDELFRNIDDFPPYFSNSLQTAHCLVSQVKAAGTGVELSVSI